MSPAARSCAAARSSASLGWRRATGCTSTTSAAGERTPEDPAVLPPGRDEAVPGAGRRQQVAPSRRVGLELASQVRDVDVQKVRLAEVARAPDLMHERPSREELARVERE